MVSAACCTRLTLPSNIPEPTGIVIISKLVSVTPVISELTALNVCLRIHVTPPSFRYLTFLLFHIAGRCPSGDDPLTHCNSQVSGQVQELKVTLFSKFHENIFAVPPTDPQFYPEGMGFFGANKNFEVYRDDPRSAQLRVGFTDVDGATYFAPTAAKAVFSEDDASSGRSNAESSMELALENIAGMRVRNVKITAKNKEFALGEDFYLENRFLVTFVPHEPSSSNIGLQAPLWCDSAYSCNTAGCAPMVKMPFLYRYTKLDNSIPSIDGAAGSSNFVFVLDNVAPGDYVGLHANSSPYLAAGIKPSGVDTLADLPADIRILVAIQDPPNGSGDDGVDIYWTKVVYGEEVQHDTTGYTGTSKGPFSATNQNDFVGTLNGFTYRGFIPDSLSASIPDAPGIILDFSNVNMVTEDGEYNFYEILVKLPTCEVTPIIEDGILDNDGNPIPIVSENVENVECSNRGQCNRDTGLCECFAGYAGVACSRQSILV